MAPTLRIGILGAAKIAGTALLRPARRQGSGVEVTAVAARDRSRAERFAARHGIGRALGSYDELLDRPDVDAVYVPLPAAHHAKWVLAAAAAGKHVLCEKPFTSNAVSAVGVARTVADMPVVVSEAYHSHHHPVQARLRGLLADGAVGRVVSADAVFCVPIPPGRDIRWDAALGGGGLLDVGYYPLRQLRALFGEAETIEEASAICSRPGIDRDFRAVLTFAGGVRGRFRSSIWSRTLMASSLRVTGDEGSIVVRSPQQPGRRARIHLRTRDGRRTETIVAPTTYDLQLRAFAAETRGERATQTTPEAAAAHLRAIDALYGAAGMAPRVSVS